MFWNIFKEKKAQQSSNNDKSDVPLTHGKEPTAIKNLNIPIPFLNRLMPIFQKLERQPLTPGMSLQIFDDAKQQITETMDFFSH